MYNELFIDTMDKVNAFAKQIVYTNGIAWARSQMESKCLNSYDYNILSGCHDLRNLMAHGFARDINITLETSQKAQLFFEAISKPYAVNNNQSIIFNNIKSHNELEVQIGEYVIAEYVFTRNNNRPNRIQIDPHWVLKVVKEDSNHTLILESVAYRNIGDIDYFGASRYYVVKDNLNQYINHSREFRRILCQQPWKSPLDFKQENGISTLSFILASVIDRSTIPVTVRAYLAHKDCFTKTKNRLNNFEPNESIEDHCSDFDDLPF